METLSHLPAWAVVLVSLIGLGVLGVLGYIIYLFGFDRHRYEWKVVHRGAGYTAECFDATAARWTASGRCSALKPDLPAAASAQWMCKAAPGDPWTLCAATPHAPPPWSPPLPNACPQHQAHRTRAAVACLNGTDGTVHADTACTGPKPALTMMAGGAADCQQRYQLDAQGHCVPATCDACHPACNCGAFQDRAACEAAQAATLRWAPDTSMDHWVAATLPADAACTGRVFLWEPACQHRDGVHWVKGALAPCQAAHAAGRLPAAPAAPTTIAVCPDGAEPGGPGTCRVATFTGATFLITGQNWATGQLGYAATDACHCTLGLWRWQRGVHTTHAACTTACGAVPAPSTFWVSSAVSGPWTAHTWTGTVALLPDQRDTVAAYLHDLAAPAARHEPSQATWAHWLRAGAWLHAHLRQPAPFVAAWAAAAWVAWADPETAGTPVRLADYPPAGATVAAVQGQVEALFRWVLARG